MRPFADEQDEPDEQDKWDAAVMQAFLAGNIVGFHKISGRQPRPFVYVNVDWVENRKMKRYTVPFYSEKLLGLSHADQMRAIDVLEVLKGLEFTNAQGDSPLKKSRGGSYREYMKHRFDKHGLGCLIGRLKDSVKPKSAEPEDEEGEEDGEAALRPPHFRMQSPSLAASRVTVLRQSRRCDRI